jgi:hypothetical protein
MCGFQDEAGNRVHLSYATYREGLEYAFSEQYLGKDCYGNRCASSALESWTQGSAERV